MNIKHLRYFLAVAEAHSFVGAARELHMSQPPLSKRIADLEAELGVKLFDRSGKKVALTVAGEAFLPHVRHAVHSFDAAMGVARSLSLSQSRRVRIAFPPDVSRKVQLDVVERLRNEKAEISLLEAATMEQQDLLASGQIDVGVLRYPFDEHGLCVSPPLAQELGVIMDVQHPLAERESLKLPDLNPYPLVHFHRKFGPRQYDELLEFCRAGGYTPPRILHSGRVTAAFLSTDAAVTFAPERSLRKTSDPKDMKLVWKPLEGSPLHGWISVVCRIGENSRLTRTVIDAISASLQRQEGWTLLPR